MSGISNLDNALSFQPHKSIEETFISYWEGRGLHYGHFGISNSTISRVAFRALGVLAAATAGTVLILSLCGIVIGGYSLIIPACILTSFFSLRHAWAIKHEEKTRVFDGLRSEIENLSLIEIERRFSWNDIFYLGILTPEEFAHLFRQQMNTMTLPQVCHFYEKMVKNLDNCQSTKHIYYIPSPSEFRKKWVAETQDLTFEQIIHQYSLTQLEKYHILSTEESAILSELYSDYQKADNQRLTDTYQHRPDILTRKLAVDDAFKHIEDEYRQCPSVSRLQCMESDYNAKRAEICNLNMLNKKQAYAACEQFLEQQKKPYTQLKAEQRTQFEKLKEQYMLAARQIDKSAEEALLQVEQQYTEERSLLISQAELARQQMDTRKSELTSKAEQSIVVDPRLDQRFLNIVDDLNRQYNARRKILRSY